MGEKLHVLDPKSNHDSMTKDNDNVFFPTNMLQFESQINLPEWNNECIGISLLHIKEFQVR